MWPRRDLGDCRSAYRRARAQSILMEPRSAVIASDSEAIQTQSPPQSLRLDCFALPAMTLETVPPNGAVS
jgi:hypothetical protein